MGKPSIFSNDYGQRMRKRKKMTIINTILVILILISAAYFGGNYYLEKKGIDLGNIFKNLGENKVGNQNTTDEGDKAQPGSDTANSGKTEDNPTEEKTKAYYEYKALDGRIYKLEYAEASGNREFTGISDEAGEVQHDISSDGKKIVFCTKTGDIVVGDDQGVIKKINSDSYKSKSTGITIEKQTTFKYYPEYVWAANPHFTSDNRIAFITYLPYLKDASTFYMWTLGIDGSSLKMAGELTNDINKISYDGFSAEGALIIKTGDSILFLPVGSYKLTK